MVYTTNIELNASMHGGVDGVYMEPRHDNAYIAREDNFTKLILAYNDVRPYNTLTTSIDRIIVNMNETDSIDARLLQVPKEHMFDFGGNIPV